MRNLARRGAHNLSIQADAAHLQREAADSTAILKRLDYWLRESFWYRGENEEVVRTPEFMVLQWERDGFVEGDCDDIATLYAAYLKALGFRCRFVAIRYDGTPDFKHVFVEVLNMGQWVAVDPTVEAGTPYRETERMVMDV